MTTNDNESFMKTLIFKIIFCKLVAIAQALFGFDTGFQVSTSEEIKPSSFNIRFGDQVLKRSKCIITYFQFFKAL